MRSFVFTDQNSNRLWSIELHGAGFTSGSDKVGGTENTLTKEFPTEEPAREAHDRLIAEARPDADRSVAAVAGGRPGRGFRRPGRPLSAITDKIAYEARQGKLFD
jgi:predicted DNA-binding WGR domain protein